MTSIGQLQRLNEFFGRCEDPWHCRRGWYDERRQAVLLASLTNPRYVSAFEPGCGDGRLSLALASRCDQLLCMDGDRQAIEAAAAATAHLSNVRVEYGQLPCAWPRRDRFDLVVLDEIGVSLPADELATLAERIRDSLLPCATVLACHWTHTHANQRIQAPTVHGILHSILGLERHTKIIDADFILDVWTTEHRSVAERDGLW